MSWRNKQTNTMDLMRSLAEHLRLSDVQLSRILSCEENPRSAIKFFNNFREFIISLGASNVYSPNVCFVTFTKLCQTNYLMNENY